MSALFEQFRFVIRKPPAQTTHDTTGFSVVELQFPPKRNFPGPHKTPQASASWSFNFCLTQSSQDQARHHRLQPRGVSTSA